MPIPSSPPAVKSSHVVACNIFISLLDDLKLASRVLKIKVKRALRESDPDALSSALLEQLRSQPDIVATVLAQGTTARDVVAAVGKVKLLPALTVDYIASTLAPSDMIPFHKYILMLLLLSLESKPQPGVLEGVLAVFKAFQDGTEPTVVIAGATETTQALLSVLHACYQPSPEPAPRTADGLEDLFKNTKIGELAREIAREIDVTDLQAQPSEDLISNMMNPNGPMSKIIGSVGTKIQSKLASGDLRQEDLMAEAMSMMQKLDFSKFMNPDMVGALAGMMGNTAATPK